MWIKEITDAVHTIHERYGVVMSVDMANSSLILFRMSKGHFRKMEGFKFDEILKLNQEEALQLEQHLIKIAEEIVDAYDSTNKSKAWNETLQDIGVREG